MNTETTSNVLFNKRVVAELTDDEMMNVNGGTSTFVLASSEICGMALVAAALYFLQ